MITLACVHYNRCNDLNASLIEYVKSTYISTILIFDNSNNFLLSNDVKNNAVNNNINVILFSSKYNVGGAGGYHYLFKYFYEKLNSDYLFSCDDDMYVKSSTLESFFSLSIKSPSVVHGLLQCCNDQLDKTSLRIQGERDVNVISNKFHSIIPQLNLFNGCLFSRSTISIVGYPVERFFIWGDETDFYNRLKKFNVKFQTYTKFRARHPETKTSQMRVLPFRFSPKVKVKPGPFEFLSLRNSIYNISRYHGARSIIDICLFILYYLLHPYYRNVFKPFYSILLGLLGPKFWPHAHFSIKTSVLA